MAAPSPQAAQPPPDLPSMPDVSTTLTGYLRTFALWCRNGFQDRLPANSALPGLMLQASDQSVPNPAVYKLDVTTDGQITLSPVALGSGVVGAPVPITAGVAFAVQELQERVAALEAAR